MKEEELIEIVKDIFPKGCTSETCLECPINDHPSIYGQAVCTLLHEIFAET